MAFVTKKDYCGLVISGTLEVSSDSLNASGSVSTGLDEHGSIIASTAVYGGASPSNGYDVKGAVAFTSANQIKLGRVTEVGGKKYGLSGVSIALNSSSAPTVSANSVEVESGAETSGTYDVPEFTVPKSHKAAMLFTEATLSGDGCKLIGASYNVSCDYKVERDEVGVAISSDVHAGSIESSLTIQQTSSGVPTVTAADGWTISAPLTQTNAKSAYPTWTVSLVKYITKTVPSA